VRGGRTDGGLLYYLNRLGKNKRKKKQRGIILISLFLIIKRNCFSKRIFKITPATPVKLLHQPKVEKATPPVEESCTEWALSQATLLLPQSERNTF
jgi:hypothetical protein